MNENSNNQPENNDLDSLLKEFQSLSSVSEQPKTVESSVTAPGSQPAQPASDTVTTVAQSQAPSVVPPVGPAPTQQVVSAPSTPVTPIQQVPVQPSTPQPVSTEQPSVQTVQPGGVISSTVTTTGPANPVIPNTNPTPVAPASSQPTIGTPNIPNPPMDSNNNGGTSNKKGKSNLTFIIILFVVIAVFILLIPKINEFVYKKPTKEPNVEATESPEPTKEPVKEKTLTCTEPEVASSEKQKIQKIYKLYYANNKVTKMEYTYKNMYAETVDPLTDTSEKPTCTEKDNTFEVLYAYDLENFTNPTQITINGQTQTISSNVQYEDDIETVKASMEANGATCQ